MKAILQKISVFTLSVILVCAILPIRADASYEIPGICRVQADSGAAYTVKTLDYAYDYNTYFSLRDIHFARLLGRDGLRHGLPVRENQHKQYK